jgi:hypothetical protein
MRRVTASPNHPSLHRIPQPVARIGNVHLWLWPEVAVWARATGRLLDNPRGLSADRRETLRDIDAKGCQGSLIMSFGVEPVPVGPTTRRGKGCQISACRLLSVLDDGAMDDGQTIGERLPQNV